MILKTSPEKGILYTTSFNEEIYESSGRKLIASFKKTIQPAYLFCTFENMPLPIDEDVIFKNITKHSLLEDFLFLYKEYIPIYLGGTAFPCICPEPYSKLDQKHKKGCHFTWWNRNCFRWFRKIVTLNEAIASDCKYLIWIDSDCIFKKQISEHFLDHLFDNHDLIYMKGGARFADETGIFGIHLNDKGRLFILNLKKKYMSGEVFKLRRWDDGYVFMKLRLSSNIQTRDLVPKNCEVTRVAEKSLLKDYIQHNKGSHGDLGIMK